MTRLTSIERLILGRVRQDPTSDWVRWQTTALREAVGTFRSDPRHYGRSPSFPTKRWLRRFLRARRHLVELGLIRLDDTGYYKATEDSAR